MAIRISCGPARFATETASREMSAPAVSHRYPRRYPSDRPTGFAGFAPTCCPAAIATLYPKQAVRVDRLRCGHGRKDAGGLHSGCLGGRMASLESSRSADDKTVVCACEDVTLHDVQDAMTRGLSDIESIKRYTGFGTGP